VSIVYYDSSVVRLLVVEIIVNKCMRIEFEYMSMKRQVILYSKYITFISKRLIVLKGFDKWMSLVPLTACLHSRFEASHRTFQRGVIKAD